MSCTQKFSSIGYRTHRVASSPSDLPSTQRLVAVGGGVMYITHYTTSRTRVGTHNPSIRAGS